MQQCKSTASILTLVGKAGQLAYVSHAVSSWLLWDLTTIFVRMVITVILIHHTRIFDLYPHEKKAHVYIIGASLSEPHTSVTALVKVVCMFAAIYHKF